MSKSPDATVVYDELGNICQVIIGGKNIPTEGLCEVSGEKDYIFSAGGYLDLRFRVSSMKSENKSASDYRPSVTIQQAPYGPRRIFSNGVEVPLDNMTEVKIIERTCERAKIICTYETDNLIMEGPHD